MRRAFVGRQSELDKLNQLLKQDKASIVVITGRRRVGKTRLAEEFCKDKKHFVLEGLAPGKAITDSIERNNFSDQLQRQLKIAKPNAESWGNLLGALADHTKRGRVVIVLDEINWLGHNDPAFLDVLKQTWDQVFSKNPKLILLLSGSITSWIHREILTDTKFLGRISLALHLKELPLWACNAFWGKYAERISAYEKFKILAMTGGIPRYLEEIIPSESAEKNMLRLAFRPEGLLYREFNQLFKDLYGRRENIYQAILKILMDGPKEPQEILAQLNKTRSGTYNQYFDELVKTGLIERDDTWLLSSARVSRLHRYRLSDNYMKFYLQFIYPKRAQIEHEHFIKLPRIESKLGFQFENLILRNRQYIQQYLHLSSDDIVMDNPFFQRRTQQTKGCQIDYLIQTRQKTLYVCEIKFRTEKINAEVINQVEQKLNALKAPKRFSVRPVLIHANGVERSVEDAEYFDAIINFSDFLHKI